MKIYEVPYRPATLANLLELLCNTKGIERAKTSQTVRIAWDHVPESEKVNQRSLKTTCKIITIERLYHSLTLNSTW